MHDFEGILKWNLSVYIVRSVLQSDKILTKLVVEFWRIMLLVFVMKCQMLQSFIHMISIFRLLSEVSALIS